MSAKAERYIIPNIARALKILELLAKLEKGASISEIAARFDIPVNSTFRIIKSLEAYGYVEEENRRYFTTPRLLYLGYAGLSKKGLVQNSVDVMHILRDEINETIMIGTMVSNEVVIIEQLPSFEYIKFTIEIGHRVPVHASAPGKAILAYMPETEKQAVIDHLSFERFNDKTIPSQSDMLDEIEEIRTSGYSVDNGEEITGIICVAAPILDYRNYPVASVWMTGPDYRVKSKGIETIGDAVIAAASKISKRLGQDDQILKKQSL
ncbi:MAG: IclR family transcriptional regulator [Spirochaetales bacterium]|uniref:IclR family transcriptional regulator n=1 Tax=Candidatus Thalassospirochaeta sargassi TaxID=3119039 RepID=A0AAJ1IH64_9SPIO|nr:IclR family transcriptional regulator [Spirochaetales bacterium]